MILTNFLLTKLTVRLNSGSVGSVTNHVLQRRLIWKTPGMGITTGTKNVHGFAFIPYSKVVSRPSHHNMTINNLV